LRPGPRRPRRHRRSGGTPAVSGPAASASWTTRGGSLWSASAPCTSPPMSATGSKLASAKKRLRRRRRRPGRAPRRARPGARRCRRHLGRHPRRTVRHAALAAVRRSRGFQPVTVNASVATPGGCVRNHAPDFRQARSLRRRSPPHAHLPLNQTVTCSPALPPGTERGPR
jgi:hypothetical protein